MGFEFSDLLVCMTLVQFFFFFDAGVVTLQHVYRPGVQQSHMLCFLSNIMCKECFDLLFSHSVVILVR